MEYRLRRTPRPGPYRDICARFLLIMGGESFSSFARIVGCHPSTIRRLMLQGPPRVDVLSKLMQMGYSVDWALTGKGAMRPADEPNQLANVSTADLLRELAARPHAHADLKHAVHAALEDDGLRDAITGDAPAVR